MFTEDNESFEIEVLAKPVKGLDISAGLGYTKAEFDQWVASELLRLPGQPPQRITFDYEGKTLPNVPELTFNIGVQCYRAFFRFHKSADVLQ